MARHTARLGQLECAFRTGSGHNSLAMGCQPRTSGDCPVDCSMRAAYFTSICEQMGIL